VTPLVELAEVHVQLNGAMARHRLLSRWKQQIRPDEARRIAVNIAARPPTPLL
jgi:hypothetical protein